MSLKFFIDGICLVAALGGAVAVVAMTVAAYPQLPAQVPVHFGLTGQITSWGPRGFVFVIPAMAIAFFVAAAYFNPIFGFVLIDKHGTRLDPLFPVPSGTLSIAPILFTAVQQAILESAVTRANPRFRYLILAAGLTFIGVVASVVAVAAPRQ